MDKLNFNYNSDISQEQKVDSASMAKSFLSNVFTYMAGALSITGIIAYWFANSESLLSLLVNTQTGGMSMLGYVVMFAPFIFVLVMSFSFNRLSSFTLLLLFVVYSALMGMSLSFIFLAYTAISIAQTFFTTAVAFGALSLYGYTTKRDLSGLGNFLFIGLIGIIVASIANWFFQSPVMHLAISAIGVLIFAGLTAYDTQNIKNTYLQYRSAYGEEYAEKMGIMGALSLYLNFLNMFMFLLQFMGNRD